MTKNCKKNLQLKIIFGYNLRFTYPWASIKNVQVTEEAFRSQKRTSSASKHIISKFFYFCGSCGPPGSGSIDPIESGSNSDPDPQPCLSGGKSVPLFLPVLMVVHGEEELLHELYLVLLRPVLEVVQAHAPATEEVKQRIRDHHWEEFR
jgi:hypothetical protein